ncbi:MAG: hypothetical protein D9C04_04115 [Nitrosopumilus sp. B06]|nr:MAG: hypothetical protein D9C04_04115 [Nitrosopumilus sp. B06]
MQGAVPPAPSQFRQPQTRPSGRPTMKMIRLMDWEISGRIGKCLEKDMHITKSQVATMCNLNHGRCVRYLLRMERIRLIKIGKYVRLTRFGRAILCRDEDKVWDADNPSLIPPPDVTARQTGPLTQVDIGEASAEDESDSSPLITNNAPAAFPVGMTTVMWTAMGGSGKIMMALQMVTVVEATGR